MFYLRFLKRMDFLILGIALVLFALGLLMIFSANYSTQATSQSLAWQFVKQQLLAFGVAIFFFFIAVGIDYHDLEKYSTPIYLATLFLLLIVLVVGKSASGARRWLGAGFFSLQPSELTKLAFIIMLAKILSFNREKLKNLRVILPMILYLLIPFILIARQPDLGTALVLGGIFLGMLLWAGLHPFTLFLFFSPVLSILLRHHLIFWLLYLAVLFCLFKIFNLKIVDKIIFLGLNILTAFGFDKIWGLLHDYQQRRILSFLNPGFDPFGTGYHALQSKIAIGSGGFFGRGFLHGSQTHFSFIPEQHTDFIFSVVGEELGFVAAVLVILLFGWLIWRLIEIAARTRNTFASFLVIGVASMLAFQLLVNVGMAIGIMPVVGVPLPFVSYGGSSLLIHFLALALIEAVIIKESFW